MISNYTFRILSQNAIPAERAYAFYSCLLSLPSGSYAEELHEQKETPISQCLYSDNTEAFWRINLLSEESINTFSEILNNLEYLPLNTGDVQLKLVRSETLSADYLISAARAIESNRFFSLRFLTPTAFKQSGSYTVLPDKELILQSLFKKWNSVFPSYPLEDEDAFQMLCNGLRVSDYNLRTTRFQLKDSKIPGFIGNLRIDARLSAPLLDIWKILITFSEYSGIGIKTALGMGGVKQLVR